jgi:hypothetical protein
MAESSFRNDLYFLEDCLRSEQKGGGQLKSVEACSKRCEADDV